MAVYVTEYRALGADGNVGKFPAPRTPPEATQKITVSGSTQSTAFGEATYFVRVHTDQIVHIAFGDNPTASTSDPRMATDQTEFFGVVPGQKLAVIGGT